MRSLTDARDWLAEVEGCKATPIVERAQKIIAAFVADQEGEPQYAEPEFDPADYDTVEKIAEVAAPLFAAHGWTYGDGEGVDAERLAATISRLYEGHREQPLDYNASGRIHLADENPHNGHPVLFDGIQVYVHVGELPPIRGDEVTS